MYKPVKVANVSHFTLVESDTKQYKSYDEILDSCAETEIKNMEIQVRNDANYGTVFYIVISGNLAGVRHGGYLFTKQNFAKCQDRRSIYYGYLRTRKKHI